MNPAPEIFSPMRQQAQHRRAHDDAFLLAELRTRLMERLPLLNRQFTNILLLSLDHAATKNAVQNYAPSAAITHMTPQQMVSTAGLNLPAAAFDFIIDCGWLSQQNNPPLLLKQLHAALQPNGALLSLNYGGHTLQELRHALLQTDADFFGGAAPRTHPMLDGTGLSTLLSVAGFGSPLVDSDELYVTYGSLNTLAADLRAAGLRSALATAAPPLTQKSWRHTQKLYAQNFTAANGKLATTLEFLAAVAWRERP